MAHLDVKCHPLAQKNIFSPYAFSAKNELKALKHWTPVHLHLGAGNVTGRVAILENRELMPGNEGFVQIVTDEPVCTVFGDRFIIRDRSASRVIEEGKSLIPFQGLVEEPTPTVLNGLRQCLTIQTVKHYALCLKKAVKA